MTDHVWHRAGTRHDIEVKGGLRVRVGRRWVAVHLWKGRVYAVDDFCPHRGASLAHGIVEHDGYVSCLEHGWEYHLATGQGRRGFEGCVDVFDVEERDGAVWVAERDVRAPDEGEGSA